MLRVKSTSLAHVEAIFGNALQHDHEARHLLSILEQLDNGIVNRKVARFIGKHQLLTGALLKMPNRHARQTLLQMYIRDSRHNCDMNFGDDEVKALCLRIALRNAVKASQEPRAAVQPMASDKIVSSAELDFEDIEHPCATRCQYAQDVAMPEHSCGRGCMYDKHKGTP